MRLLIAVGLLATTQGSVLKMERTADGMTFVCGQQTTLSITTSSNAAGTPLWSEVTTSDGECLMSQSAEVSALKFCGPGSLLLSRMTCHPGRHDYKAMTVDHPASEYTTNCEVISTSGTVVAGWLGSFTLSC